MNERESLSKARHLDEMKAFAETLNQDLGPMFGRDVARLVDEHKRLQKAVKAYFRAKYDSTWGPSKDWHKRHDEGKREDELMSLFGMEQTDFHRG